MKDKASAKRGRVTTGKLAVGTTLILTKEDAENATALGYGRSALKAYLLDGVERQFAAFRGAGRRARLERARQLVAELETAEAEPTDSQGARAEALKGRPGADREESE